MLRGSGLYSILKTGRATRSFKVVPDGCPTSPRLRGTPSACESVRLEGRAHGSQNGRATRSSFGAKDGGEGGIRTPGTLRFSGFQDRRDRPLCHLSDQATQLVNLPRQVNGADTGTGLIPRQEASGILRGSLLYPIAILGDAIALRCWWNRATSMAPGFHQAPLSDCH